LKRFALLLVLLIVLISAVGCSNKGGQSAQNDTAKFFDGGYEAYFQGAGDYKWDASNIDVGGEYNIYFIVGLQQYLESPLESWSLVTEVRVRDIKVVNQPKVGKMTISLGQPSSEPKDVGKDYVAWTGGKFTGKFELLFKSNYLGKHVLGKDFSGTHGSDWAFGKFAAESGVSSDDLRFKVSYQIQVTDSDGSRHTRNVEVELFPEDFMKARNSYQYYSSLVSYSEPFNR